ncbi:MAG TPA: GNAT family N-acetyltransferase [Anaerolineales bacterium]|nr:GNAT family N-acetyltransferase [Anaerolineales bacterium]
MSSSGYLHPLYVQSLAEFGEPLELPSSKGWILKRPIAGTSFMDGMGPYPIFACQDWSCLGKDLDRLEGQLVSAALVTDPFGAYTHPELLEYFKDLATPYKEHFVIDLKQRPEEFVSAHHRRNAQKALKAVQVEVDIEPIHRLSEWTLLYEILIERYQIRGISRFSPAAFEMQLRTPGIAAFRAVRGTVTVGMLLWYVQGDTGYYHLGAYNPDGYQLNASFALFWKALDYFSEQGLRWLSLGAGAGAYSDGSDGLTRFKRGWSTGTRTAYFCGRIFDREKYQQILSLRGLERTGYFPAYRSGEFA